MKGLKKLLIKKGDDPKNPQTRLKYGMKAGVLGIVTNLVLCCAKIVAGVLSGSITIIADGINNLSDTGSSMVTVVSFKMSAKPADKKHPFGHGRSEQIGTLFVAFIILILGVFLAKTSIDKIITPAEIEIGALSYAVLGAAIVLKIFQMLAYFEYAKAIGSDMLKASGVDSRNDVITTAAVLVATIVMAEAHVNIDGYMGLLVSVFIVISSIKLLKDTLDPLLGTAPTRELTAKVKKEILKFDGVLGVHDLMVHNYGAGHIYASVHVEVSHSEDVLVSHELIDSIERHFKEELDILLTIHMDPIVVNDENVNRLKLIAETALEKLNESSGGGLSMHDFRVVVGVTNTNVLFDVAVPYASEVTEADIVSACSNEFSDISNETGMTYRFVIDIDRIYT